MRDRPASVRGGPVTALRRWILVACGPILAVALLAACATSTSPTSGTGTSGSGPEIGPYLDVTGSTVAAPDAPADAGGRVGSVLAFVLAEEGRCVPRWGGTLPLADPAISGVVDRLISRGEAVTVASGGANGPYLETVCPDAGALAAAYAQVLDTVGTNRLDIDVEGDVAEDVVAAAVADLQRARGTQVMLTVQVEDQHTGITPEGMAVVRAVRSAGVDARVNAMLMNFSPEGPWRAAMTEALDAALRQVGGLDPGAPAAQVAPRVGATIMIGRNDMGMTTTLDDAAAVRDAAEARGLGFLGFWSAARDNGGCPGAPAARSDCSGVEQEPHAFAGTLGGTRT